MCASCPSPPSEARVPRASCVHPHFNYPLPCPHLCALRPRQGRGRHSQSTVGLSTRAVLDEPLLSRSRSSSASSTEFLDDDTAGVEEAQDALGTVQVEVADRSALARRRSVFVSSEPRAGSGRGTGAWGGGGRARVCLCTCA
jgi:hypothetical protein